MSRKDPRSSTSTPPPPPIPSHFRSVPRAHNRRPSVRLAADLRRCRQLPRCCAPADIPDPGSVRSPSGFRVWPSGVMAQFPNEIPGESFYQR